MPILSHLPDSEQFLGYAWGKQPQKTKSGLPLEIPAIHEKLTAKLHEKF